MRYTTQDIADMRGIYMDFAEDADDIDVEDRLRTYIVAGVDPLDFQITIAKRAAIDWQETGAYIHELHQRGEAQYPARQQVYARARTALFKLLDLEKEQRQREAEVQRQYLEMRDREMALVQQDYDTAARKFNRK